MNHPRATRWALLSALVLVAVGLWANRGAPAQAQTPTRTPTPRATAMRTPTPTPTPTATPTPTVTPGRGLRARVRRVILPAPSVKHNLVGDVVSDPDVPLSANYPTVFGDTIDFGMANFRDITAGPDDGDGIAALRYTIYDMEGAEVFARDAAADESFCAFGGDEEACIVFDFAAYGNRWPDGTLARSGRYTLVAFATGAEPDHKGAWALNFELRLSSDRGLQTSDGAVLVRRITPQGDSLLLEVETLGFTPFAQGTHLHVFPNTLEEAEAVGGADGARLGVLEFPIVGGEGEGVAAAYGLSRIRIPASVIPAYADSVCVAIAHPDHSVLIGRAVCVALP